MGFYFRRRTSLGPLRFNWSKGGLGISLGVRGLRAGITAHGQMYTSANLPGSGLYFLRFYKPHAPTPPSRAHAVGFWFGFLLLPLTLGLILAMLQVLAMR